MGRIFKLIVILLVLGAIGVIGFAYLGDMSPDSQEQRIEVTLPDGSGMAGTSNSDADTETSTDSETASGN
ncbi:hypothetical protein [Thioclava sp. DLFJ4-1]|uniref:hypothetical protein n=1 Tax=Thioclava sp. DLFJ4-1 TaxID=1915313 RepID=UPI000996B9C8|nr:hypothetical protein [Thioclava sp. DLFJ4-1]OOY16271.1 hypothetical protein BMI85_12240 [Thioclava sp. DLFJ4-1]